ncbi:hypothetical protein ABIA16_004644 [Sinorhizobium fredii]
MCLSRRHISLSASKIRNVAVGLLDHLATFSIWLRRLHALADAYCACRMGEGAQRSFSSPSANDRSVSIFRIVIERRSGAAMTPLFASFVIVRDTVSIVGEDHDEGGQ